LSYRLHGEEPLIWLSDQAAFESGQAVRGGVPVCWPWFGDLARNPAQVQALHTGGRFPAHGLVRNLDWLVRGMTITEADERSGEKESVQLEFSLPPTDASPPLRHLPAGLELRLSIHLGERLQMTLSTRNGSDQTVALTQALHTYFAVGDIHQASIDGLEDRPYIETLEGWSPRRQKGRLHITGETDRIYHDLSGPLVIRDSKWGRRICIEASGSSSAVVWNPWVSKARRLSQFADDAWQHMLCIETANVMDDMVTLAPGEQHSMGVTLWSEAMSA
jgi:glucose-6-phosphate 1-epimerase